MKPAITRALVLPFFFIASVVGILLLAAFSLVNYFLIGLVIAGVLTLVLSRGLQAFAKTQIVLLLVCSKMLFGIDTQRFERLKSIRP
jgi:hypothetical protein